MKDKFSPVLIILLLTALLLDVVQAQPRLNPKKEPLKKTSRFQNPAKITLPKFKPVVAALKPKTKVPIVLPVNFPDDDAVDIYLYVLTATKSEYELSFDIGENCRGAGACNYGYITGKRSRTGKFISTTNFQFESKRARRVSLAKGIRGYFIDFTCGANCDSAKIFWVLNGFQYMVGIKGGKQKDVVKLANDVIRNKIR